MGIVAFLVLGLYAGIIAKLLIPGADGLGLILTMVLGVAGAMLGGFLGGLLLGTNPLDAFFDLSTWVAAVVGSVIVLAAYRAVVGRGGTHRSDVV